MSGAIAFGYLFDDGEIAVPVGRLSPRAGEVLYRHGFWRRTEQGSWGLGRRLEADAQIERAAEAIRALGTAGFEVRNWHDPSQGGAELIRHYAWLLDTGVFPDAAAHTAAARTWAIHALDAPGLSTPTRRAIEEVTQGLLAVEARHSFGDGVDWWLARRTDEHDVYVILRHDAATGDLGITDEYASWYAGQARRDYRVNFLRDTTVPASPGARAQAACVPRAARMSAAPSTAPAAPTRIPPPTSSARR
ncbi:hypothetical protein ABZW30_08260 [Kitasatospora sp. NPDC004669]|uniref:hypothetical protein n=1 Tax=Kitasatospora sp. NPDC004669 TaxID=3154555 RepID=UPI0033B5D9B1